MANDQPSNSDRIVVKADPDIADLIPGFLENRHKDVTAIRTALGEGDFSSISFRAHSMKGAGAGYGFEGITEIGAEMEIQAKASDLGGVEGSLIALERYLERVQVQYE